MGCGSDRACLKLVVPLRQARAYPATFEHVVEVPFGDAKELSSTRLRVWLRGIRLVVVLLSRQHTATLKLSGTCAR
jgi:hypothetical protein